MLILFNLLIFKYLCFKKSNFTNKEAREYGKKGLIRSGSK